MAVSKRLRHEVMRRDNHACRYCGATAPDVKLTIDHVMPTALGGGDDPANLVTACADCNAGKSASSPDASLVDDVKEGALRWSAAMKRAAAEREAETEADTRVQDWFRRQWESWFSYPSRYASGHEAPAEERKHHNLDDSWGWKRGVRQLLQANAGTTVFFEEAIRIAMKKPGLEPEERWRYFCGVMWNEVKARQKLAAKYMVEDNPTPPKPVTQSLTDPFDYMAVFDDFVERLVEAMGGDEQVQKFASHHLWEAMPVANGAWHERIADTSWPLNPDQDTLEEAATDAARDAMSDYLTAPMAEIRRWHEFKTAAKGGPRMAGDACPSTS